MLHKNEELPSWYRQRRYIHFDEPLSFQKSEKLVTCPDEVARHAFWPLIRFKVDTLKIRQDKSTGKIITKEKQREISYAAHSDSQIFSYYCQMLSEAYENKLSTLKLSDSVLAFDLLEKIIFILPSSPLILLRRKANAQPLHLISQSFLIRFPIDF